MTVEAKEQEKLEKVKVWDVYTRLFHWLLLICIVVSFVSVRMDNMDVHFISGHCVLALIIFRILWGLFGARTALFASFIKGPGTILRYLKNSSSEEFTPMIGHSPIAALSVIAMIVVIGVQVMTGLVSDDEILLQGPLAQYVSGDFSYWATGFHSLNAKFIFALVILHLAAIAFYKFVKKQGLVKPMVIGSTKLKKAEALKAPKPGERNVFVAAIAIFISIAIAVYVYNLA